MRCHRCKRNTRPVSVKGVIHCASCGGKAPSWIYKNSLLVVAMGLLALAIIFFISYKIALYKHNNPTVPRPQSGCGDDGAAWVIAKNHVKKSLISPSSVKFDSASLRGIKAGECSFAFAGDFQASNAFGVMIAHKFTVRITYSPASKSYTAADLSIWP